MVYERVTALKIRPSISKNKEQFVHETACFPSESVILESMTT